MKPVSKFIRDALGYSSSLYVSQLTSLIIGFFTARILGPELLGVWASIAVILTYTAQSDFGVINGMNKTFPFLQGKKEFDKASRTRDLAFTCILIIALFIMFLIISSSMLASGKYKNILTMGLIAVGLLAFCQQLTLYYNAFLRVNRRFDILSKSKIVFSLSSFLIIPFILKWGIYGLFWAIITANCLLLGYLISKSGYRFHLVFETAHVKTLVRVGMPITAIGLAYVAFTTVDRIMIIKFLPTRDMGYYRIATLLMSVVTVIPGTVGYVMFPSLLEVYGAKGSVSSLRTQVEKPTFVMISALLVLIGLLCLITPFAIQTFLPQYVPGILPARILLLSLFFLGAVNVHGGFLVAINKQGTVLRFQVLAISVNILLNYIFIKHGLGLSGVALGTGITYFIYGNLILWYSYTQILAHKGKKEIFAYLFYLNAPFFVCLLALYVLDISFLDSQNRTVDFVHTIESIVLYLMGFIGLMVYMDRKHRVLRDIMGNLRLAVNGKKVA